MAPGAVFCPNVEPVVLFLHPPPQRLAAPPQDLAFKLGVSSTGPSQGRGKQHFQRITFLLLTLGSHFTLL